jgi:hypothetical protein
VKLDGLCGDYFDYRARKQRQNEDRDDMNSSQYNAMGGKEDVISETCKMHVLDGNCIENFSSKHKRKIHRRQTLSWEDHILIFTCISEEESVKIRTLRKGNAFSRSANVAEFL